MTFLAVFLIAYALFVVVVAVVKPQAIWDMKKILWFRKHMGEKGTEVFFYVWSFLFLAVGIWLLTR